MRSTSRRWPAESSLDLRLVSRLSDAVVLGLAYPGLEARRRLLQQFTQGKRTAWTAAAVETAAQQWQGGVNELRDAVARINRQAGESGNVVDETTITADRAAATDKPRLSSITRRTAAWFQLSADDLRGTSRRGSVATARAVAMYLARDLTGTSFQRIGSYFGNRDHTTVMHGCRRAAELIDSRDDVRLAVSQLRNELTSQ